MDEEKIKWNKCKQCGLEFGLHPTDPEDGHDFEGLPFEGYEKD